jgi:hypothetical protein
MKLNLRILGVILFGIIIISMISFEQAWAANATTLKEISENPVESFLTPDGTGVAFLAFIVGIAIYSLFVWYFYRFISKRDLFPKLFYVVENESEVSKTRKIIYAAIYVVSFPVIIFVWFTVLAFFIYVIAEGMPLYIAIFVSLTIIAVVRIISYYREDAAKEIAKMIPYAILSFVLTSVAIYANPNFFTDKELGSIPTLFLEHYEGIIAAVLLVSVFEYSFRVAFLVKRKFWPVTDEKLEETIASEVKEITKVHFKKMEDKEKELEKKIENKILEFKKLEDKGKELENKLKELQKKSNDSE